MSRRWWLSLLLCNVVVVSAANSLPETTRKNVADLLQVYVDAFHNDATFRAAFHEKLANQEGLAQARAAVLPSLIGQGILRRKHTVNEFTARFAIAGFGGNITRLDYGEHNYAATLTQAIFNVPAWARFGEAKASVRQAAATFNAAAQDLILRTANAYFDVLEAEDTLGFTRAEKRANERQLEQAKQRYKVGLDAITSVYDARAAYDANVAREIAAQNELDNRREALRQITGIYYEHLAPFKRGIQPSKPQPSDVDSWLKFAKQHNFTLLAAHYGAIAAHEAIKAAFGGHFPTLDLIGRAVQANARSVAFRDNDLQDYEVGISVNVPIYQGGSVVSQVRQARQTYLRLVEVLEETRRATSVAVRTSYNNVISGSSAIEADRQAVLSTQSSLESTEAAYKVGTRTIIDVLERQRDLFDVKRILARDAYNYLRSLLELKRASGVVSVADLEEINTLLRVASAQTTTERFRDKPYHALPAKRPAPKLKKLLFVANQPQSKASGEQAWPVIPDYAKA